MNTVVKFGNKRVVEGDSRPTVALDAGGSPRAADEIEAILLKADLFYQRGGRLVRAMTPAPDAHGVRRDADAMVLHQVTAPHFRETIDRHVRIERNYKTRDGVSRVKVIDCPLSTANEYLARGPGSRFPEVHGIARAPFIRDDGTICSVPGYDLATGLLLAIPSGMLMPPANPTRDDAVAALDRLSEPVAAMPFRSPVDKSVFQAGVLTGVARPTLDTAPLFGFSAPTRGSGKSKLCEFISVIATGKRPAVVAVGHDPIETEKRLILQ